MRVEHNPAQRMVDIGHVPRLGPNNRTLGYDLMAGSGGGGGGTLEEDGGEFLITHPPQRPGRVWGGGEWE